MSAHLGAFPSHGLTVAKAGTAWLNSTDLRRRSKFSSAFILSPIVPTLPSGLPDVVADQETLSRFLTQKDQFNSVMAKPAALKPHPEHGNASVFRLGENNRKQLIQTWRQTTTSDRSLKAVVFFTAAAVRATGLGVTPEEPPPAHANVDRWPFDSDPEMQIARHKEIAARILSGARVWKLDPPEEVVPAAESE